MTRAAASTDAPPRILHAGYLERSQLPLTSLVFLLPLVIVYEILIRRYGMEIVAASLLQRFFLFFGATGRYLPAFSLVGILLTWHIARNDSWQLKFGTFFGMAVESIALVLPIILLNALAARIPLAATEGSAAKPLVMALGAGIYEELVFRLIAFTFLNLLLLDVLKLRKWLGYLLIVLISGLLFGAYHYLGLGEVFDGRKFAFRVLAGIYFGTIFLFRGFGITAGTHTAYDILWWFSNS
ncbi:MAG TPA: CPBP family intramembrane glutamic endopeptidase [Tepidisphaeraceae bacterium]|jgi:membrane protease YdiL (CAAX protease family)